MRAVLIFAGARPSSRSSDWLLYVFGFVLIASGIKMLMTINQEPDLAKSHRRVHATSFPNHGYVLRATVLG